MSHAASRAALRRIYRTGSCRLRPVPFCMRTAPYTSHWTLLQQRSNRAFLSVLTLKGVTHITTAAAVPGRAFDLPVKKFSSPSREANAMCPHKSTLHMVYNPVDSYSFMIVAAGATTPHLDGIGRTCQRTVYTSASDRPCRSGLLSKWNTSLFFLAFRHVSCVPGSTRKQWCRARQPLGRPSPIVPTLRRSCFHNEAQQTAKTTLNFATVARVRELTVAPSRVSASEAFPVSLRSRGVANCAQFDYRTTVAIDTSEKGLLAGATRSEPTISCKTAALDNNSSTVDSRATLGFFSVSCPSHDVPRIDASRVRVVLQGDFGYVPVETPSPSCSSCSVHGPGGTVVENMLYGPGCHAFKHHEVLPLSTAVDILEVFWCSNSAGTRGPCREREPGKSIQLGINHTLHTGSRYSGELSPKACPSPCGDRNCASIPQYPILFPIGTFGHIYTIRWISPTAMWKREYTRFPDAMCFYGKSRVQCQRRACGFFCQKSTDLCTRPTRRERLPAAPLCSPATFGESHSPQPCSEEVPSLPTAVSMQHAVRFLDTGVFSSKTRSYSLRKRENQSLTEIGLNVPQDSFKKKQNTGRALDRLLKKVLRHSKHRRHPRHMLHVHQNKRRCRQWFQKPCKARTGMGLR